MLIELKTSYESGISNLSKDSTNFIEKIFSLVRDMIFGGKYLRSLISKFILGKLTYQVKVSYLPIFF